MAARLHVSLHTLLPKPLPDGMVEIFCCVMNDAAVTTVGW